MSTSAVKGKNELSQAFMKKRVITLFVIVCLGFSGVAAKLGWVQVINNSFYRDKALNQRMRPIPVDASRGAILDRNGNELAVSITADSIYAVPTEIEDPEETAYILAGLLNMDEAVVLRKITTLQQTVWVQRKVDNSIANAIRELNLPGILIAESSQRFYPKDNLAAHIIGFAGIDNQGLEGIEVYYDDRLRGSDGRLVAERDATGKEIPDGMRSYVAPIEGNTIVLTIDEVIQYIAEREIKKAVEGTGSKRGMVLAMDPKTGEVLATAIYPSYNPNSYNDFSSELRRNLAIIDEYEPGSTFKVITAAAALEEGLVSASDEYYDPGYIKVKGSILRCWKAGGHGHQTFEQALGNSCNPVFVELAQEIGASKLMQYIEAFGFGMKTGIDFPGEVSGKVQDLTKVGLVELSTTGFGQGISVTPIQLLSAVSAIANGGSLMKPMMVKEVISSTGEVISSSSPTKVRQVISEQTAKELTKMMVSVVTDGSGNPATVPGFQVAGKTGTAQKAEAGGYGAGRIASFVGFAPADDPKVAMLVLLDEPSTDIKYGGVLTAPIFGAIMKEVVRYLELTPASLVQEITNIRNAEVPNVTGAIQADAKSRLSQDGFLVRIEGNGSVVTNQVPKAGSIVAQGTSVILYCADNTYSQAPVGEKVTVPNLLGKVLKEAAIAIGSNGLGVIPRGSGIVVGQSPAAGTIVSKGTVIEIYLEER